MANVNVVMSLAVSPQQFIIMLADIPVSLRMPEEHVFSILYTYERMFVPVERDYIQQFQIIGSSDVMMNRNTVCTEYFPICAFEISVRPDK